MFLLKSEKNSLIIRTLEHLRVDININAPVKKV